METGDTGRISTVVTAPLCGLRSGLLAILLGVATTAGFGQSLPFRHYSAESEINPLPSSAVQTVYVDDLGFVWFAVYSTGLVRYDGHSMDLFNTSDGLRDLNVWEAAQDREGRLWIASDAGLSVTELPLSDYDPGGRPHFHARLDDLELADVAVRQSRLTADTVGSVFIGTDNLGILRYNLQLEPASVDTLQIGRGEVVRSVKATGDGTLWAAVSTGEGGRIVRVLPSTTVVEEVATFDEIPNVLTTMPDHSVIVGTREGSVWRLSEVEGAVRRKPWLTDIPALIVGLLPLEDGQLWVATEGAGLLRSSTNQSRYSHPGGQKSRYVHQVTVDSEGNLWIARTGGASKLPYKFDAIQNYVAGGDDGELGGLPAKAVTSVVPPSESDECAWVGSIGGSVACVDAVGEVHLVTEAEGLPSNRVNALLRAVDGVVWVGTHRGIAALVPESTAKTPPSVLRSGPVVVNGRSYRLDTFRIRGTSIESIASVRLVRDLAAHDSVETIWFPGYLQLSALVDNQWVELGERNGLPVTLFRDVIADDNGRIWIGTLEGGLYRSTARVTVTDLKAQGGTGEASVRFENVWSKDTGAPVDEIESLLFADGLVWVGTPAGLFGLDPVTVDTTVWINEADGMPASNATSMDLSSATGSIWVGTNGGLAEIAPVDRKLVRTVTKTEGLVDNEVCYYGSVRAASDGSVFYGTCKGLAVYRPYLDRANTRPPRPRITRFQYHENEWGDNELVVEYAGLSFANEGSVRYRTRLRGYDSDWSEPTSDHRIRYTNLSAFLTSKAYEFEVKASNDSGLWSTTPALISVRVLPPWWARWWAVLVWIVLAVGSVILYVRRKTRIHEAQLAKEREINEQLRRVDKLKDEFLANTSHELRTPLNGIIGIAESLLDGVAGAVNDVMRKNLLTVAMSGRRLAGLVNDILDFSKMADRDLELSLKPISVGVLTDVVMRISEPLLAGKELQLINDVPRDLPAASADEGRLQQILINLVGNAVKFTHRGHVRVSARVAGEMLEVSVSDTGIGIPEEKFSAVFEAFEQVDASTAREYGGTGLGLSITKKLVESHGGEIWFDSEVGVGSTFTFTLHMSEEEAQLSEAAKSLGHLRVESEDESPAADVVFETNGMARASVLVVDDEPVNLQVLANHLSFANYRVSQALNGREALDLIDSGEKFDVVLLDIMMPRMSGYEVCERIRQKYLPNELPVIMVTAKNQVSDLVQGLDSGANDYLAKPFSKDELLARLKTHLNLLNINQSYGRFVPREFLHYLGRESILDVRLGDSVEQVMTIFVSDIRSFTTISEAMTPSENFEFVNDYMAVAGPVIRDHGGFIDRYTGDAIMGLFADTPDAALDAAIDTLRKVRQMNAERAKQGKVEIKIGIGIHTGSLRLGIVGEQERAQGDIFSDAVNLANRIEGLTKLYGVSVIVSGETLGQLGRASDYGTRLLGHVQVKGKNNAVSLYEVFDGESEDVLQTRRRMKPDYDQGIEAFFARDFGSAAASFGRCLKIDAADLPARMLYERSLKLEQEGVPDGWDGIEAINFK